MLDPRQGNGQLQKQKIKKASFLTYTKGKNLISHETKGDHLYALTCIQQQRRKLKSGRNPL
jgi:hypothetical protein